MRAFAASLTQDESLQGPYPLTTALFASVTTVLLGAVSTSVTVLVGQVLMNKD